MATFSGTSQLIAVKLSISGPGEYFKVHSLFGKLLVGQKVERCTPDARAPHRSLYLLVNGGGG